MNRRKELTLQRLSKLDIKLSETEEKFKEKPVGAKTIEAAMGMYMCVLNQGHIEIAKQGVFLVKDANNKREAIDLHENTGFNAADNSSEMYDKLDVNRSAGFLLYSYSKGGMHSTLAEGISVKNP